MKYESFEQINTDIVKAEEAFGKNIPKYLEDFFDQEQQALKKRLKMKEIYGQPLSERRKFVKNREKEFWETNELEVIKNPFTTEKTIFEPQPINNVFEEDANTRKLNILACEHDIRAFAIRYFKHYLEHPFSRFHIDLLKIINRILNPKKSKFDTKWAIAAPRANAKCEKFSNLINKLDGSLVQIKDINIGDEILSFDNNYKLKPDKVIAKVYSGKKLVRDFKLRSGRMISVTDNHRLFTINGEVEAKNLKIGNRLATPRIIKCNVIKNTMSNHEATFLAYMIAEGSLSSGNCTFVNFDKIIVNNFKNICDKMGFDVKEKQSAKGHYGVRKGCRDYLRKYKLYGCKSTEKLIPREVFQQDDNFLKEFVSAFIDTDGWVSKYNLAAGITLANEQLIDQLFTIFLRLGFQPSKLYRPNNYSNAWALIIYGKEQLIHLLSFNLKLKQQKLLDIIDKNKKIITNRNVDLIDKDWKKYLKTTPHFLRKDYNIRVDNNYNISRIKLVRIAIIDNNQKLLDIATSDICWDEIVTISDYYETDTYDIETKKYHNFISNNIFSHNSTLISNILPIWCVVYNKKNFIIMLSDTADQAEDFLSDIKRELIDNQLLKRDFPYACGQGLVWRRDEIITNNNKKIKVLGSGNKIRGRKFGVYRPDLIIGDDLENSEMVRSESQREFIRYKWFNKDVLFAGGKEGITDFLMCGTVLGKDSLLNALLNPSEYPDWNSKRYRAVEQFSDSPLWDDWAEKFKNRFDKKRKITAYNFYKEHEKEMLDGIKILWPEGDPYYGLMIYKLSDPSGFETEKQNSPVDTTKIYVTKEQLHWEYLDREPHKQELENAIYFGAIDPSLGKKSSKGDYSAILTLARNIKTGFIYVVDINLKRRSVEQQIEDILKLYYRFGWKKFGVETNAFQYVLAEALRKQSKETGAYIPVIEINQTQDKKLRFEGVVPFILDGTVVFDKSKADTVNMYDMGIEQIVTFTGENDAFDDVPDCLSMCFSLAKAPRFKLRVSDNKHDRKRR